MKLKQMALANAMGVLGAGFFVACYLIALLIPDLYKSVSETWFHMFNISTLWKNGPSGFGLGIVSFTLVSWVSGWLIAWLYNKFS